MRQEIDGKSYDLGYEDGLKDGRGEVYDLARKVHRMQNAIKGIKTLGNCKDMDKLRQADAELHESIKEVTQEIDRLMGECEEEQV